MISLAKNIISLRLGKIQPIAATFQLTNKCNCRCSICKNWESEKIEEIGLDTIEGAFKQSALLRGLRFVNFSGGEPFLLDNLKEYADIIYRYARPLCIRFATNGLLGSKIEETLSYCLDTLNCRIGIRISLDGLEETHDSIRGMPGAFKSAIETAERLIRLRQQKRWFSINFGYVITKDNYSQLKQVYEIAKKMKVGFNYKPILHSRLYNNLSQGDKIAEFTESEKDSIKKHNQYIMHERQDIGLLENRLFFLFHSFIDRQLETAGSRFLCYAGLASCIIYSNSDIVTCLTRSKKITSLKSVDIDGDWKKIKEWNSGIREEKCRCLTSCDTFPSIITSGFPFYRDA